MEALAYLRGAPEHYFSVSKVIYTLKELKEITTFLTDLDIRHDIHNFPSGAVMIDVWVDGSFYVLQLEENSFGVSKIDEKDPGFDSTPAESFKEFTYFFRRLKTLLEPQKND